MPTAVGYLVEIELKPISNEAFLAVKDAEAKYVADLVERRLLLSWVSASTSRHWAQFAVMETSAFEKLLAAFPLYEYFDYRIHVVRDMLQLVQPAASAKKS